MKNIEGEVFTGFDGRELFEYSSTVSLGSVFSVLFIVSVLAATGRVSSCFSSVKTTFASKFTRTKPGTNSMVMATELEFPGIAFQSTANANSSVVLEDQPKKKRKAGIMMYSLKMPNWRSSSHSRVESNTLRDSESIIISPPQFTNSFLARQSNEVPSAKQSMGSTFSILGNFRPERDRGDRPSDREFGEQELPENLRKVSF